MEDDKGGRTEETRWLHYPEFNRSRLSCGCIKVVKRRRWRRKKGMSRGEEGNGGREGEEGGRGCVRLHYQSKYACLQRFLHVPQHTGGESSCDDGGLDVSVKEIRAAASSECCRPDLHLFGLMKGELWLLRVAT
ncbi:unnamed protein product, partial [Pleuronectes platessa]